MNDKHSEELLCANREDICGEEQYEPYQAVNPDTSLMRMRQKMLDGLSTEELVLFYNPSHPE